MWKKILAILCLSVVLTACHVKSNLTNETGWTVLQGIYVKAETGHDVFTFKTQNGENEYIFMTFAEGCDAPIALQTGDKIEIKIVVVRETNGVNTTQVLEWAKLGDAPVSVDSDVLTKIESLSQKLSNVDTTEK